MEFPNDQKPEVRFQLVAIVFTFFKIFQVYKIMNMHFGYDRKNKKNMLGNITQTQKKETKNLAVVCLMICKEKTLYEIWPVLFELEILARP